MTANSFQLPLSGSPRYGLGRLASVNGLSTPSLGITDFIGFSKYEFAIMDFQLPLSGSLKFQKVGQTDRYYVLSTPSLGITLIGVPVAPPGSVVTFNSLSRDHFREISLVAVPGIPAFNSLSRDHRSEYERNHRRISRPFNSLSRDHRALFRDFLALRGFLPRRPFAQMISKTTI